MGGFPVDCHRVKLGEIRPVLLRSIPAVTPGMPPADRPAVLSLLCWLEFSILIEGKEGKEEEEERRKEEEERGKEKGKEERGGGGGENKRIKKREKTKGTRQDISHHGHYSKDTHVVW